MSLTLQTVMRFSCALKKLFKKLKKNVSLLHERTYISKILIKLPKTLFPTYRVVVNPIIIETNRRTLNFLYEDSLNTSFSTEFYDSLSSSEEEDKLLKMSQKNSQKFKKNTSKKCCKHCQKLYYHQDDFVDSSYKVSSSVETTLINTLDLPERSLVKITPPNKTLRNKKIGLSPTVSSTIVLDEREILEEDLKHPKSVSNPQGYSTPIKLWSDEVEQELKTSKIKEDGSYYIPPPPPMPCYDCLNVEEEDFLGKTPLRRITVGDIQSVKLRPPNMNFNIPKTPEVHDMMAVLRKRFAAMHSPLFDDVTMVSSDSSEELSLFYSDFSKISWGNQHEFQIGVV